MKCSLCGHEFSAEEADSSCKSCLLSKGCRLIKCPHCGYEMPREPRWLRNVFRKRSGKHGV